SSASIQQRLVQDLIDELHRLPIHVAGAGAHLLEWLPVRFQVENLKVLARGVATGTPFELLRQHLITLPRDLALDTHALAAADSPDSFVAHIPPGPLRTALQEMPGTCRSQPQPFFLEASMDHCYLAELIARADALTGEERDLIIPLCAQEADIFHLSLAVRGRFHYNLPPDQLLPLHVAGTRVPRNRFAAMLADPDAATATERATGRVLDTITASTIPGTTEALAWTRFVRLADRAFRRSHVGLGTVVGYTGLRRLEVANLVTLSEGLRMKVPGESIRPRMIPRANTEAAHV
ncbi:MAG: V-type ATPase subunit, partial [bacterium]